MISSNIFCTRGCAPNSRLGVGAGLKFREAWGFMALFIPQCWLAQQRRGVDGMVVEEKIVLMRKANQLRLAGMSVRLPVTAVFMAGESRGHLLGFPWGTHGADVCRR